MRRSLAITVQSAAFVLLLSLVGRADEALSQAGSVYAPPGYTTGDTCQGDCGFVCVCEPQTCYSIRADLLWLGRSEPGLNPLIYSDESGTDLLTTGDMEFNVEAGIDVGFRAKRANGQTWELRYFGIFDQLAEERRTHEDMDADPTNDARIYLFNAGFGPFNDLTTVYSSDLHSGEANVWLCERWGFNPVIGLRWLRQNEELDSYDTNDNAEGALVEFSNDLFGCQVGLRRVLWETPGRCRVEATVKGGIFANDMDLDSSTRTLGTVTPSINGSFNSTAYAGEISISAVYRFSPSLSARIGYTGLWLDRVGLAADQLEDFDFFTGAGSVDLTTLIYQGGHFGLEFAW